MTKLFLEKNEKKAGDAIEKMGKQTPKMSSRVVNAIRNLREAHGSTSKEIMNYIMSQCNFHESTVNRQVTV